ncbi:hypothetical protein T03_8644 [Trichinella britovi]|uniref:Receptor expression-enhancing protein 5 n=2 Tax=Trichinella TaxID=6333 RepID=A0A0V1CCJ0_TRIBR|nr:hypothetical protein T05_13210 [Trichinella murrelli]KRY46856.1 hypothetical protein T03_8644 [Trichinella britovi]
MEKIVHSICMDVVNAINDDSALVGKLFGKIEQRSGRSRYQAAIVLAGVICMLLAIYNPAVKLLCDLICIVYPVMKTLAEMESIEKSKCKQWMFYWSNLNKQASHRQRQLAQSQSNFCFRRK